MSGALYDAIQAERAKYPEGSRSAVLPALRLAQEEHGWLSAGVLREVADALDVTPAFVASIATFYDQLHTEPVGEHLVEVCTNVSCALYGAQQVLESFESDLDCRAGETSADGKVTLLTIECLGGCGWGTVVAVDHRYHLHVSPDDTAGIVEELRAG
ncbi:MAG TPA: NAD(P)H-dependent oxidoreductase subunit E [Gaiellaceae bacterium]